MGKVIYSVDIYEALTFCLVLCWVRGMYMLVCRDLVQPSEKLTVSFLT